jgi:two-component system, sensor histidine kinase and response regulator
MKQHESKPVVLYLDDEEANLNAFKAVFRREYDIVLCINAEVALQALKNRPDIQLIVSDQRMPFKTGIEFFADIKEEFPDPIRILLTGYADLQAVIDAINKGNVYRFIQKPWNEDELRVAIQNALDLFNTKQKLVQTNIDLQRAYLELDNFVFSASHELRSPINTMKSVLHLLDFQPSHFPEQLPNLHLLCDKLDEYVLNIIEYYKGERLDHVNTTINLRKFVSGLIEDISIYSSLKQVKTIIDIDINIFLPVDTIRLGLILRNLVHNAVKYQIHDNPEKLVRISAKINSDNDLMIEIEDNGTGISFEIQNKIFEMFQRSNEFKKGTGLGLYIVKKSVQKLYGTIDYKTEIGKGTTFFIKIPQ